MKGFAALVLCGLLVVGCGSSGQNAEDTAKTAADNAGQTAGEVYKKAVDGAEQVAQTAEDAVERLAAAVGDAQQVELGCGSCTYHIDGFKGCGPAVKIGDQAYKLTGVDIDAHSIGLCKAPKMANVEGKIEDGVFVASMVDFGE